MDGCVTFTVHRIHAYVCVGYRTHRINVHDGDVRFSVNNTRQDHTRRVIRTKMIISLKVSK